MDYWSVSRFSNYSLEMYFIVAQLSLTVFWWMFSFIYLFFCRLWFTKVPNKSWRPLQTTSKSDVPSKPLSCSHNIYLLDSFLCCVWWLRELLSPLLIQLHCGNFKNEISNQESRDTYRHIRRESTTLHLFLPESRNPLANGLRSIFSLVICRQEEHRTVYYTSDSINMFLIIGPLCLQCYGLNCAVESCT